MRDEIIGPPTKTQSDWDSFWHNFGRVVKDIGKGLLAFIAPSTVEDIQNAEDLPNQRKAIRELVDDLNRIKAKENLTTKELNSLNSLLAKAKEAQYVASNTKASTYRSGRKQLAEQQAKTDKTVTELEDRIDEKQSQLNNLSSLYNLAEAKSNLTANTPDWKGSGPTKFDVAKSELEARISEGLK